MITNRKKIKILDKLSVALLELMKTSSFKDISITDICNKSNITRISFYRNCDGKEDIVKHLCNNINSEFLENIDLINIDINNIIESYFNYYYEKRDTLKILSDNNLLIYLNKSLLDMGIFSLDEKRPLGSRYLNAYIVGGLCHVLQTWVEDDFNMPREELVKICVNKL